MHGKVNKRIDMCVSYLLCFVRDKSFERYKNLIKGSTSKKISDIHNRHRSALQITNPITEVEDGWQIKSANCNELVYKIKKMSVEKDHVCELKCRLCAVCIHSYTCSCIDSIVRGNLCKHIHAVHMSVNTGGILKRKKESDIINDIVTSDGFADLTASSSSSDALEDKLLKNKINTMTSLLDKHEISQNTRKRIGKSIDNIINLICADQKQGNKNNEPPNKKIKLQKRFYSTKKKPSQTAVTQSKPSTSFKLSLIDYVNNTNNNDHSYCKTKD